MAGQRLTDKTASDFIGTGDLMMVVDVSDTTGSSAGTSKKMDMKYVMQTDKISVSNADLLAMDDGGGAGEFKTLISAPGAGFMIIPFSITILTTYAASTDTSAKTMYAGYVNDQTTRYWATFSRIMYNTTTNQTYQQPGDMAGSGVSTVSIEDTAFYLWSNGNFNGGWSADVYITYNIAKLS